MNETTAPLPAAVSALAAPATPGLVWAFRIHDDGTPEPLPLNTPIETNHDGWLWLHFNLADARTDPFLLRLDELPPNARAVLVAPDGQQQLQVDDACVFGVFADLITNMDGVTKDFGYLHFAMTDKLLVSARRHAMSAAETARQALDAGRKLTRVASLLELIVEHVIESIANYSDELDEDMDKIEEEVWARNASDQRQRLCIVRKATVHLHRQLQGLLALFKRAGGVLDTEAPPDLRLKTNVLAQKLEGLDHDIVAMRERAHLLQEEVALKIAEDTNRSLYLLTIITTFFLPASLVAGIFGMNVKGLPLTDTDTGFVLAMAILIVSSLIILIVMQRMRILLR